MEVVIFVIGMVIGAIISIVLYVNTSIGDLIVDSSDPDDGPYLFLELSKDVDCIKQKQHIVLKVNTKNYISQK
jgi:hypothetical protein